MTAIPQSAWALLSKPMLFANGALILASAGVFRWVLPKLPARITLQVDLYGQRSRPGSPDELWIMGAIMAISLSLPLVAALTASAGALDPIRHPDHKALLCAHRRQTVRIVEGLVLGINLVIGSAWLGLSVGQLPEYAWPGHSVLPVALGLMAALLLLPLIVLLPQHVRLTRSLQRVVGATHDRAPELDPPGSGSTPPPPRAHWPAPAATGPGYTSGEHQRRTPLWLVLILLPSLVLLLSVWLSP